MAGEFYDLFKIPAPACIHHPTTHLMLCTLDISFPDHFIKKAAEESDPAKRIMQVAAGYIGSLHVAPALFGARIPINPILGETYQAHTEKGTKYFAE